MSLHEIDGTSALVPRQDDAIVREDVEAEGPGIGGDGEHGQNPAKQAAESDAAEEEEDQAPAAALLTSATAASTKKIFGIKRSTPTVKKGVQNASYSTSYLINF